MSATDHTESAYPHALGNGPEFGLTKRELFAAMAMQGLCASGYKPKGGADLGLAQLAVERADALLATLSDEPRG